ncbi:hypothetical protein GP486_002778 [Trichoglossum hirsutum]|uniref:Uncharacterized protein n=1 Tax=Trichoglossum hirsutum TaxID=265104 RepID=A0A9P8RRS8_9PEZI|nr:hypothetical protein GP486_002778 [Trichoglossum hirsutum]
MACRPEGHLNRRETLCQKAEQEDRLVPTRAEFQEMLKNPDALYKDIIELIEKSRDFHAHRDNYREQLFEVKQIMQYSRTIGSMPAPSEGRRFTKLPDLPLFNGSMKDGVMYDNWLIQVENKLRGNADVYPTKDLKIIYVAGQVSGDALTLISSHLWAMNRHAYGTIDELYEYLEELYGNPNKKRNARQAFKDLAMRKE